MYLDVINLPQLTWLRTGFGPESVDQSSTDSVRNGGVDRAALLQWELPHGQNRQQCADKSEAGGSKDPAEDRREIRAALGEVAADILQVAARMHLSKQNGAEDRDRYRAGERSHEHHHAGRGAELSGGGRVLHAVG